MGSEEEVPGTIYRTKGRAGAEPSGSREDRQRRLSNDDGKDRIISIEEDGRQMTRGVDSSLQTIENHQRRSSKELVMGQGSQRMKLSTRPEESQNEDIKDPVRAVTGKKSSRRSPPRSPHQPRQNHLANVLLD